MTESNYPVIDHKKYGIYDFAYRKELYKKEELAEDGNGTPCDTIDIRAL